MAKATKPLDPSSMTEEELRAYVNKLELALSDASTAAEKVREKPWERGEKRDVYITPTPTNNAITINGKPYVGRMKLDRDTYETVMEMHQRAVRAELQRMESRGNLVSPHLIKSDDIMSRRQPTVVANL